MNVFADIDSAFFEWKLRICNEMPMPMASIPTSQYDDASVDPAMIIYRDKFWVLEVHANIDIDFFAQMSKAPSPIDVSEELTTAPWQVSDEHLPDVNREV